MLVAANDFMDKCFLKRMLKDSNLMVAATATLPEFVTMHPRGKNDVPLLYYINTLYRKIKYMYGETSCEHSSHFENGVDTKTDCKVSFLSRIESSKVPPVSVPKD